MNRRQQPARVRFPAVACALWFAIGTDSMAEEPAGLPPPAPITVEFHRDIRPIFEASCIRCHGPERPRSRFRLDNGESALKGGASGVAILPGNSLESPLIQYVAHLEEGMEMPPLEEGEPLTREQVALLRAWIDQGAEWPEQAGRVKWLAAPVFRWIGVDGNTARFREQEWTREGGAAGFERFSFSGEIDRETRFFADGRILYDLHEHEVRAGVERRYLGFIQGGFEQHRKYFDDQGGVYERALRPVFRLGRDLHLDVGRAWIEAGITVPDAPRLVIGYEHLFREGMKSTLQWGPVLVPGEGPRRIVPAFKTVDEQTHVVRLDLAHDIWGWRFEDGLRFEFYDLKIGRENVTVHTGGPSPMRKVLFDERHEHRRGENALRVEKRLLDWLFLSGGHLYSRMKGEASFRQESVDGAGGAVFGDHWIGDGLVLDREAHVFSLAAMLGPWENVSISGAVQNEWTRQEMFGGVDRRTGNPAIPALSTDPALQMTDFEQATWRETASVRYSGIPRTVLFAEGRLRQEHTSHFEQQTARTESFLRDTAAASDGREFRIGFNTSPWHRVAGSGSYKRSVRQSDYDHVRREPPPGRAFPGFIIEREIDSEEFEGRVTLQPLAWMRTSVSYRRVETDYRTLTEAVPGGSAGGGVAAGIYRADTYSLNAVLAPFHRLQVSGTVSYSDSVTRTASNDAASVAPWRGHLITLQSGASFALNDATDLNVSYSYSSSDFGEKATSGLPAVIDYRWHQAEAGIHRRLGKHVSMRLQYALSHYREPAGFGDYTAHGVFAVISMVWP